MCFGLFCLDGVAVAIVIAVPCGGYSCCMRILVENTNEVFLWRKGTTDDVSEILRNFGTYFVSTIDAFLFRSLVNTVMSRGLPHRRFPAKILFSSRMSFNITSIIYVGWTPVGFS